MRAGARFPAPHTPLGTALLSALTTSELLSILADHTAANAAKPTDLQALIDEVDMIKQAGVAIGPNVHGAACVIAAPAVRWAGPVLTVELTVPNGTPELAERFAGPVKHTAKLVAG